MNSRTESFLTKLLSLVGSIRPVKNRIPFVQQMSSVDCGLAALSMTLEFHGEFVEIADLRRQLPLNRAGTSAEDIVLLARRFGLRAQGVSVLNIKDIQYLPPASILHWQFNHYVVFECANRRGAQILDPALGPLFVPWTDCSKYFTGVALVFERQSSHERKTPAYSSHSLRLAVSIAYAERRAIFRLLGISVVVQVFALPIPLVSWVLLDYAIPSGSYAQILTVAGLALGFLVVRSMVSLARNFALLEVRQRIEVRLTIETIDRLFSLPYSFFEYRRTGELSARLSSIEVIRDLIASLVVGGLFDGAIALSYILIIWNVNAWIGMAALVALAVRAVFWRILTGLRIKRISSVLIASTRTRGLEYDAISSMMSVKALAAESSLFRRWEAQYLREQHARYHAGEFDAISTSVDELLSMAGPLLLLLVSSYQALGGSLSLGAMMAATALGATMLSSAASFLRSLSVLAELPRHWQRIAEIHAETPEPQVAQAPSTPFLTLTCSSVSFGYSAEESIVFDLDLEISSGDFILLTGASGSGKSTILKLLCGLLSPREGSISVNGRRMTSQSWIEFRRSSGVVLQTPQLLVGTLGDQISMRTGLMTNDEMRRKAQIVGLEEIAMNLPLQYDTPIGEMGVSLSGGELQRLALARALAADPQVLLLDEALNALDSDSEFAIADSLKSLGYTVIYVTHRDNVARLATRYFRLSGGRLSSVSAAPGRTARRQEDDSHAGAGG